MAWLVAAASVVLSHAACPEPATTEVAASEAVEDASSPVAIEGMSLGFDIASDAFGEVSICGTVTAIVPDPTRDGHHLVTVQGTGSEGGTLGMWHLDRPLLRVGDVVGARLVVDRIQIHQIRHLTVVDGQGRLLFAQSEDGDARYAPGWGIGPGEAIDPPDPPPTDRAYATGHALWFSTAGLRARSTGDWRQLDTPGGTYFLRGGATRWHVPPGTQAPPDTSNYSTYILVRAP